MLILGKRVLWHCVALFSCLMLFGPAPAGAASSANGTTIPPATQIVDSGGNVWTLASGVVVENGATPGYSANVTLLLYDNGVIYQENSANNWWSWTGSTWAAVSGDPRGTGSAPSVGASPSASGTKIPPATQIVDGNGAVWTLASGVVMANGEMAGYSAGVTLLLYSNGVIYQENSASAWWAWTGSTWAAVSGNPGGTTAASVNGVCGAANGQSLSGLPTSNLCAAGTASAVGGTGPWSWSCSGSNGGATSSCGAQAQAPAGNGACGPSNGQTLASAPTNLCVAGTASVVSGSGPWSWSCGGSNGGATAQCSAARVAAVNGACGSSQGQHFTSAPTGNLCSAGTATAVSGGGPWMWSCTGSNGGSTPSCSALAASASPSASGTTIPPATQLVDTGGNVWTLASGVVIENGKTVGYSANVILLLYFNGIIYQENSAKNWWSWTGSTWAAASGDPRGATAASVNGTCGFANGSVTHLAPTANLCSAGTASRVGGSGPWSWTCSGSNGGTNAACSASLSPVRSLLYGVNLSSAEWGSNFPGTYGVDYYYPTASELDYYNGKGLTLIRIPFAWERMQPDLDSPLDAAQVGYMTAFLNAADALGMFVIIDAHNFGRYGTGTWTDFADHGNIIGSAQVPVSAFADFWSRMASQFQNHPSLLGYDLMNEPHDMGSASVWPTAAQAAVNAIRAVDAIHYIMVEGDSWAGAETWLSVNGNLNIADPSNLIVYEAHSYWDANNSGTYSKTYEQQGATPQTGVNDLEPFTSWISQHGYTGYVGEYGVPNNDPNWLPVLDNALTAIKQNGIWGTYWAGGPWWSWCNELIIIEPCNGTDAPAMSVVQQFPSQ
jgi:endoglucanase